MTSALMPVFARADIAFERGEGVWLFDDRGERYLDLGAGVAVNSLGHCHPHLVAALTAQAGRLWHTSNLYRIESGELLARRLVEQSFADFVFFTNSGAESIECAIKMARRFHSTAGRPERYRVVTFEGAFHGRTLATIAAGGSPRHMAGFGPAVEGFDQVPLGDEKAVEAAITGETAAILIEPVQGEGGLRPVAPAFLRFLRDLCDRHGLLLMFDEVQTGIGRTGTLFAYEHSGVAPDVMALAKGLGGGFPMGACLATREAASGMTAGSHGSTFGGNPLAMAVGNAVLDVVAQEDFLAAIRRRGLLLRQRLAELADRYPTVIDDIRGEGMMIGIRCHPAVSAVVEALYEERVLTVPAADNVMRLLPPLVISDEEIGEAVTRLDRAFAHIAADLAAGRIAAQ